jgi:hypothetical protein
MQNVAEVFDLWPSDAEFGRDIAMPYSTVAAWKQRGSIPVAYWREIIRAARRRGHPELTADALVDLHARKLDPKAAPGFSEEDVAPPEPPRPSSKANASDTGHFSRFKHLRRSNFRTAEEIEDHIRALRDEWSHR